MGSPVADRLLENSLKKKMDQLGARLGISAEERKRVLEKAPASARPAAAVPAIRKDDGAAAGEFKHGGRNKEYYLCQACGEPFWRREIDPRSVQALEEDPVACPACGSTVREFLKDPETGKVLETAAGTPVVAVYQVRSSTAREAWNKAWAARKKQLPIRTAQGQFVKLPANFIRDVWPVLTNVQRTVVVILALLTDAKAGFAAVGVRTLAMYCKPVNRRGPLDNRTIREALRGLEQARVEVWRESEGKKVAVPVLTSQKLGRAPTRYWLNLGE